MSWRTMPDHEFRQALSKLVTLIHGEMRAADRERRERDGERLREASRRYNAARRETAA